MYFRVNEKACNSVGKEYVSLAGNTLKELNLNCNLLAKFRASALKKWTETLEKFKSQGKVQEEAVEHLMEMAFDPKATAWPPFFTTIRIYFGIAAENRLHQIGFDG